MDIHMRAQQAVEAFEREAAVRLDSPETRSNLAVALIRDGQTDSGRALLAELSA